MRAPLSFRGDGLIRTTYDNVYTHENQEGAQQTVKKLETAIASLRQATKNFNQINTQQYHPNAEITLLLQAFQSPYRGGIGPLLCRDVLPTRARFAHS